MTYYGYITRIKNVRKHPNADRLLLGECFNNQVVVGMDTQEGQLGIYFPTDGQLSQQFLEANKLLSVKDSLTGERSGGFFDKSGRVRAQRFRKERSDGFFCPIESLSFTGVDLSTLNEGMQFTDINNVHICNKYITEQTQVHRKRKHSKRRTLYPLFHEHIDTEQLAYNLSELNPLDYIVITEKLHGTSQRSGLTMVENMPRWKSLINNIIRHDLFKPTFEWKYVCGTRRTIFEGDDSWFGEDGTIMRNSAHQLFVDKLHKGETIYYEIVGYISQSQLISNECSNEKLRDKAFIRKYGKTTKFTYGCQPGQSDVYVYRITMTNVDGIEKDLSWNDVKTRCKKLGVNHVPELASCIVRNLDTLINSVEKLITRESTLDARHIMEGAVIRIDGSTWKAFKHKSFEFKVIEGIIKDSGVADLEEQS